MLMLFIAWKMPMFQTELKCRYSDNTFGHALDSCWHDFVSFVSDFE